MARQRQQRSVQDRLIPRAVWDANKARRRARRDRGVDSDESTVDNKSLASAASARVNNPEDPETVETLEETIEQVLRRMTIAGVSSCLPRERQLPSTMTR